MLRVGGWGWQEGRQGHGRSEAGRTRQEHGLKIKGETRAWPKRGGQAAAPAQGEWEDEVRPASAEEAACTAHSVDGSRAARTQEHVHFNGGGQSSGRGAGPVTVSLHPFYNDNNGFATFKLKNISNSIFEIYKNIQK